MIARRRLLVLLPSVRFGGAESHTLRVAGAAAASGMAVTLAAEAPILAAARGTGLDLLDAPLGWRDGSPDAAAAQDAATRATLAAARPDAVLLALPWPDHASGAIPALAALGVPTLVAAHLVPHDVAPPGITGAMRAAARSPNLSWAAVSAATAARLAGFLALPPSRFVVVPNGVDRPRPRDRHAARAALRETLGCAPDAKVALFLGRLDGPKGARSLPGVALVLARRVPGAVLAVAGDGHLAVGVADSAVMRRLGHLDDPLGAMLGSDALLMPSHLEGAPLTFLEAALVGLPVVASPEALEAHPDAARLAALAPAHDPVALAEALAEALAGGDAVRARAAAARRLAEAWPAGAMADRWLTLLRTLPAKVPGHAAVPH